MNPLDRPHHHIEPANIICFTLISLIILLYYQTGKFDFVELDDHLYLFNGHVQYGLTIANIQWAFTEATRFAYYWIPLTWLSFLLDNTLYGMNFGGYHITNMLLHILNTLLLFTTVKRMTGTLYRAGLVALLFAIHPIHVESVAWITERKDVLSTFFWMATVLFYERHVRSADKKFFPVTVFFALGLMSKPMLVTLPFTLLLLDYWPLGRLQRQNDQNMDCLRSLARLIWEKWPLFFLAVVFSFLAFHTQQSGHVIGSLSDYPWTNRIGNALIAYFFYLKKMIWPFDLTLHYPRPDFLPVWQPAVAFVLLIAATFAALKNSKRKPYIIIGWLWYLGTLFPVIGLVVIGPYVVADRYAYIPFVGLYIMIIWYAHDLTAAQLKKNKYIFSIITILITLCVMSLTWNQIKYWKDSETLFRRVVTIFPKNSVAYHCLALFLANHNRHDEAIPNFKTAIQLSPNYTDAYYNLGNSFLKKDLLDEAIHYYMQTISMNPKYAPAFNNLGMTYIRNGDLQNGIAALKRSVAIDSNSLKLNINLKVAQYISDTLNASYEDFILLLNSNTKDCAWIDKLNQEKQKFDQAVTLYKQFMSQQEGFSRLRTENMATIMTMEERYMEQLPLIRSIAATCPDR